MQCIWDLLKEVWSRMTAKSMDSHDLYSGQNEPGLSQANIKDVRNISNTNDGKV
jgi:hypothetical protein